MQDVSRHCEGHFSNLVCSKVIHLLWINHVSIPWMYCYTFHWSIPLTCLVRVRSVTALTGGSVSETSPPSQAQMSCSLWPSHTEGGQAEFGTTLMCHIDLDVISMSATHAPWSAPVACLSVDVWLVSASGKNVALLSAIPHEQPSLEGMVQQEAGALWLVNAFGLISWRQRSTGGAFEQICTRGVRATTIKKGNK